MADAIEIPCVQGHGRAERVSQIQHDLVELRLAAFNEGASIADVDFQPRIVKRAAVHTRQPFARHVDHVSIQFGQHHALHAGVAQQVVRRASVATTNDQRLAHVAMRNGGQVDHRFMVEKLVLLRCHETAIDAHGSAE